MKVTALLLALTVVGAQAQDKVPSKSPSKAEQAKQLDRQREKLRQAQQEETARISRERAESRSTSSAKLENKDPKSQQSDICKRYPDRPECKD